MYPLEKRDKYVVFANDTQQVSIMSSFSTNSVWDLSDKYSNATGYAEHGQASTPMPADWQALNDMYSMYGYSSTNSFEDNTVYGFDTNISTADSPVYSDLLGKLSNRWAITIVDGGGIDHINMRGISRDRTVDLRGTSATSSNLNASSVGSNEETFGNWLIAPGVIIENATGGNGNDLIIGNKVNNILDGSFGSDKISGKGGKDTLIGGVGADEFSFDVFDIFKKKLADEIVDFNTNEGDFLSFSPTAMPGLGLNDAVSFVSASSKKQLKNYSKQDYDFVFFEKKGKLYYNGNGTEKKWGDPSEGCIVAILKGKPELTAGDFTLLA